MQTLKEDSSWTFIEEFTAKNGSKHFEIECINCGIHEFIVAHTTPKKCYCMSGGEERMLKMTDAHRKSEQPDHSDEEEETELGVINTDEDKDCAIAENEMMMEGEAERQRLEHNAEDFNHHFASLDDDINQQEPPLTKEEQAEEDAEEDAKWQRKQAKA